ncbi:hemolysin family protein [Varunaivibrio sulfuroxidans]|uniref:CBS domain protein n=1 Tax=Varunaivibrio sulfuroxidans TaxID=1773489 RepID=A0A4V2UP93_9PROT|nr:hemolysin family protein [Varunaivibrio sulfuroxidans]TCS65051.1 CBS domain protein [Varunaivibrio sulfuroxidans]WES29662.1 hemolysin family protein [Varunaivibrio sulfuroxidans]
MTDTPPDTPTPPDTSASPDTPTPPNTLASPDTLASTTSNAQASPTDGPSSASGGRSGLWRRLISLFAPARGDGEHGVRETLEELIDRHEDSAQPMGDDERALFSNILQARGLDVEDVMIPRADIVAIESEARVHDVIAAVARHGHSRYPVYRANLDDVIGMVHIKDVLTRGGDGCADEDAAIGDLLRKVLFVAPSMQVLELLLEMRVKRCHLALVVDEYGGIDGLVTIEDLVEVIVGEIEDEHDREEAPPLLKRADGAIDASARVDIEALEEAIGPFVDEDEREDFDTLGGLVFSLAGRVPIRGEILRHRAGVEFEILDADPRRIKRVKVSLAQGVDRDREAS